MAKDQTIGIGQATLLTGTDLRAWRQAVNAGLVPNVAAVAPKRNRRYERDDLIAMAVFRELRSIAIPNTYAARIASDVRTVLGHSPDIEALYVVRETDRAGAPRAAVVIRPGESLVLMRFSIAKLREAADAVLDAATR